MATALKLEKPSEPKTTEQLAHGSPPSANAPREEKARYVFARYSTQNDHYVGLYETWTKSILFLLGRHWLKWNRRTRRFATDTDVPAWRQQPVTQVVYAVYRTAIAKLTKQKPAFEVVPPSGDSDDRESAHLAGAVLDHLWRLCKVPTHLKRGIGWFLCTGQTYVRVYWDPKAGKLVPLTQLVETPHPDFPDDPDKTIDTACPCDEDGDPITDDEGKYDFGAEPHLVPEGEIALGVESPMNVRLNPEAESPEDAYEMFVGRLMPIDKAASEFEVDASELKGGADEDRSEYDDLLSSAVGAQPDLLGIQGGNSQAPAIGDRVLVLEYYHDRTADFPHGRYWIQIGTKVVWPKEKDKDYPSGEAPLPDGFWPPLIPVQDVPVPGQPHALGLLPQIVPLNESLNHLDGKILEHHVTMAMGGKWIVAPDDRGLSISSDPAQVLASKGYAEGKPPIQADLKPLPEAVYREREVIMGKVSMVSGFDRQDLGQPPEGVTAGRAMLVQQEKTDSVFTPSLEAWEHALEEVGRRMVVLAQHNYTEPRTIQIRGERGAWEVRSFMGADLSDGLDVRVQVGSSFPWSKAAQWDARADMLAKFPGLVTSPTGVVDKEALAKYMDTGAAGLAGFESDEDADLVEVQREHAMFEAFDPQKGENQLPQLAFWQSNPKHLAAHFDFMKRDRARYDRWSPAAQQAFMQHMQLTMQAVDQIAGQLAGPATPGQPGAEPQPGAQPGAAGAPPSTQAGGQVSTPQLTSADFSAAGQ